MLLAGACLLLAACTGDRETAAPSAPSAPPSVPATTAEAVTPAEGVPEPGEALDEFVAAAAAKDTAAMWELLTEPSRERLGPSLAAFRAGAGARLLTQLAPLTGPDGERVLSERITLDAGVAAVAAPGAAFAAALRLEDGQWRLELGAPIRIRALRPDPGETIDDLTQIAAEFRAPRPILEAGLWIDGSAVPARTGGVSPSYLTVFAEVSEIPRGPHSVVAFAVAGEEAAALAWPFRATPAAP